MSGLGLPFNFSFPPRLPVLVNQPLRARVLGAMATLESAIDLEGKDIQGDRLGCDDYAFVKVGEPIPVKPQDYSFNLHCHLPSQPLAVSEQSQLIFVAHSDGHSDTLLLEFLKFDFIPFFFFVFLTSSSILFVGFCVARTEAVIESAKEIKNKGSGSSIQDLSVVDVPIANVRILALSTDSSMLAASVGGDIHFFSVHSLLKKVWVLWFILGHRS